MFTITRRSIPIDTEGLHKLACYLMRSPVNLSRLRCHPESELILYESKSGHDANDPKLVDPLEFLARVLGSSSWLEYSFTSPSPINISFDSTALTPIAFVQKRLLAVTP